VLVPGLARTVFGMKKTSVREMARKNGSRLNILFTVHPPLFIRLERWNGIKGLCKSVLYLSHFHRLGVCVGAEFD